MSGRKRADRVQPYQRRAAFHTSRINGSSTLTDRIAGAMNWLRSELSNADPDVASRVGTDVVTYLRQAAQGLNERGARR